MLLSSVELLDSWKWIGFIFDVVCMTDSVISFVYCSKGALTQSKELQKIKVGSLESVSPGPGGTFPVLRATLSLTCGAPDLLLQQCHTVHQLLQLAAGSQRPVWLPALILIWTAVSRAHLKRPVHLTGQKHSSMHWPVWLLISLTDELMWTINLRERPK